MPKAHLIRLAGAGVLCLLPFAGARAAEPAPSEVDWAKVETIVAAIEAPRIPERSFRVSDFLPAGGSAAGGDGVGDARPAIQAAIAKAAGAGGGRVVLPPGVWLSRGPIRLESRIELHLEAGAHLLFAPEPELYLPVVETRWEGTRLFGYSPLIYAKGVEDVAITGPGTIDGNLRSGFHAWHPLADPDMQKLRRMGFDGVPLEERVFGAGTHLRPPLLQILGGRRVLLEGFTAIHSPFWVNHLVYCDQVVVRGIRVESHFPNNDGVDVDSSRHVLIENSVFRTGDDAVVIKSGRDLDGRTVAKPSEFVVVRGNDMGGEDGIALGSEMSGGIRHVYFTDNILRSGSSAIRFKANLDRGGTVEHIGVRRFKVGSFNRLFWFQLSYPGELGGHFPATYRDLVFEDFEVEEVGTLFEAHAPAEAPLRDVLVRRVAVAAAERTTLLENVENLVFDGVTVAGKPVFPATAEAGKGEKP